jgi:transposase-like protein
MTIVTLRLPEVKYCQADRPRHCPYCSGETFQRWGQITKPVRDPRLEDVRVYRYRCCHCQRTFRHYPEGVGIADQTDRCRVLASICWTLGLSYRSLAAVFAAFGIRISRMSAWRDVQEQAEQLRQEHQWGKVRVLGVDGMYVRGWGNIQPILVAVDLGTSQPVALGYLDEKDPKAVKQFLEPLMERMGVSVIVTDDLSSYKTAADELGLEQQVCQFHVRRWVGRALRELRRQLSPEWLDIVQEVTQLVDELPPEGEKRLWTLVRKIPERRAGRQNEPYSALDQLRYLLTRLAHDWTKYRLFDWQAEVPWTNNQTEQTIGRMKMRARSVRGYKNWSGMHNALLLSGTRIS